MTTFKKFLQITVILVTCSLMFACAGAAKKITDIYDETLGKMQKAEKMLDQIENLVTQKQFARALELCDQVIQQYGSTPTYSTRLTTYGQIAETEKARVTCLKNTQANPKFLTRKKLADTLVAALKNADEAKLGSVLSCEIGRATPSTDHAIVYDTLGLAKELVALRKDPQGNLLPFNSSGTRAVLTESYSDQKARRFALAYDKAEKQWYIESFLEGSTAEVMAVPYAVQVAAVPPLSPAQQQQLRQDFAQYMDPDGLISQDKNPGINTSGNGLLYTSYYYLYLYMYGMLKPADKAKFIQTVQACRKDAIDGLYNRTPTKTDQEGPDDYIGIAAASSIRTINAPMAGNIYDYGEKTFVGPINWVFNNENPGTFSFSAWFGRMPQFLAHVQMSTGRKPQPWRRVVWTGGFEFGNTSNPDGNQSIALGWLEAATLDPSLRVMRLVATDWKRRVLKNYPNGMKQVFSVYFNNPSHPLAIWGITDFPWEP